MVVTSAMKKGAKRQRIEYIDFTRGLIFLLMISSHALTLSGVAETSLLMSALWLPRGWATTSFIILSGFSVGVVFSNPREDSHRRLLRRAGQIALVMFFSNILMLSFKHLLAHDLATLSTTNWWIGLITFKTPYSISGVLAPTFILLMLLAAIINKTSLILSWGLASLVLLLNALFMYFWLDAYRLSHLVNLLFVAGIGGFPVLPFISIGLIGYCFGQMCASGTRSGFILMSLFPLSYYLSDLQNRAAANRSDYVLFLWESLAHFTVILFFSLACTKLFRGTFSFRVVANLGKFALFSFIFHRIILQLTLIMMGLLYDLGNPQHLYGVLFVTTVLLIHLILCVRSRDQRTDRLLKAVCL